MLSVLFAFEIYIEKKFFIKWSFTFSPPAEAQWVTWAKWVTFRLLLFSPNNTDADVIIESCQDVLHHPIFF